MTVWTANLLAYSLQLTVLVVAAVVVVRLVRLREPRPAVAFWQSAFAAAVLLPVLQPRVMTDTGGIVTRLTLGVGVSGAPLPIDSDPWWSTLPLVLAAGTCAHLAWLGVGVVIERTFTLK